MELLRRLFGRSQEADKWLLRFSTARCQTSPLYRFLSQGAARDRDVLKIAACAPKGQPMPPLFLGAVHYLLTANPDHPLSAYYPDLTPNPKPAEESWPHFRDFCLKNQAPIRKLMETRLVQTNEVRRCAVLVPGFALISAAEQGRPLSLVEVGASMGLNLLWDKYRFEYKSDTGETVAAVGASDSRPVIACTVRGAKPIPKPEVNPSISSRLGVDLNILDASSEEDRRWLLALIWPEHHERRKMIEDAFAVASAGPLKVVKRDMLDVIPEVVSSASARDVICIFHSFTFNQIPGSVRNQFESMLADLSKTRRLYRMALESVMDKPTLRIERYEAGSKQTWDIAETEVHAHWIKLLGVNQL
ncbi:MAG: DUF2332 domain-containing protein [Candidatus Sumerlaeaceae bacterium]|nr:DUF2332 domain-containing protein [Candidatus Sumerlaeaceae bacterium]